MIVERLVDAAGWFVVALRTNEGFQQALYDELADTLRTCAVAWSGADSIPRQAVNVMVDPVPATHAAAEAYPEPQRQRIYDAGYELHDLLTECTTDAPNP
ncbi:hypothetical protein EV193_1011053 [Herbihabitans rhizosphaerae]|uniref:Uncharacterized protein n=1 Tax=Herbihabitans rhizosphaerae TaxID=1872711 RepID=A0A4Q7L798_9PSEU|nr:hypothetical protein EV193_1011053 [Herbihabitans rhizosphaerae]